MLYLLPVPVPVCGMTGNKLVSFHYLACETLLSAPTAYQEEIFVAFLVPSKIFSSRHGLSRPVATFLDTVDRLDQVHVSSRHFSAIVSCHEINHSYLYHGLMVPYFNLNALVVFGQVANIF